MTDGAEKYVSRAELKDVERELQKTKEDVSKEIHSLHLAVRDLTHAINTANKKNDESKFDYDQLGRAISGSVSAALNNLNLDGKISALDEKVMSIKTTQPDKSTLVDEMKAGIRGKAGTQGFVISFLLFAILVALILINPNVRHVLPFIPF